MFWRKFRTAAKFCTVFWTSFSILRNVAHFKQNDSCSVIWGQCRAKGKVWTQILSNRTIAHRVFHTSLLFFKKRHQFELTGQLRTQSPTGFSFLTIRPNWKQNNSCADWLGANFEQHESCARRFSQVLSSLQYGPIWSKTTVAQSVWRAISRSRKVAHGVFDKF